MSCLVALFTGSVGKPRTTIDGWATSYILCLLVDQMGESFCENLGWNSCCGMNMGPSFWNTADLPLSCVVFVYYKVEKTLRKHLQYSKLLACHSTFFAPQLLRPGWLLTKGVLLASPRPNAFQNCQVLLWVQVHLCLFWTASYLEGCKQFSEARRECGWGWGEVSLIISSNKLSWLLSQFTKQCSYQPGILVFPCNYVYMES